MDENNKQVKEQQERIAKALRADIPHHYVNGFATALGSGDVIVVLEQNGEPTATVNLSYTVAKTLYLGLAQIIATLESATGRTMLTTQEMDEALVKADDIVKAHTGNIGEVAK